MTTDPRAALDEFIAALERHLSLSATRGGSGDTALRVAGERVGETFLAYDESLFESFGEATPLDIYDEDDDGDDGDDLDGDEDDDDDDLDEEDDDFDDDYDDEDDPDEEEDDDPDEDDGRD